MREKKQNTLVENANRDELRKRIADMSALLQDQLTAIAEYNEQLIPRLIEKVTVYEDKFTVEFKSGVTVDVEEYNYRAYHTMERRIMCLEKHKIV